MKNASAQKGRVYLVVALAWLVAGGLFVTAQTPPKSQAKPNLGDTSKPKDGLRPPVVPTTPEMVQFINNKLEAGWSSNKIKVSGVCDDFEFIRRASLDIIGRIARVDEIDQYLRDPEHSRRSQLIERLLKSEEYARNWGVIWANWLLTRSGPFGRGRYHEEMERWLADQFAQNRRFDEIVRELLTASGKNSDNGAVNFVLAHLGEPTSQGNQRRGGGNKVAEEGHFDTIPITSRTTRLFLGIQTQCAQCHDHPFDARMKQQHFWGVNVFFRQVQRLGDPMAGNQRRSARTTLTLLDDPKANVKGTLFYEKRNGVILQTKGVFLDGTRLTDPAANRREKLAELILQHENFPRAYVNRIWAHFMGRGFSNPVDDFNESNQISHPELLDELARNFKASGYDSKALIRWICNSYAYNLKSTANGTNDKPEAEPLFSRMLLKPMSPEQLFESLMVATQAEFAEGREGRGRSREQWLNSLITNFGDDEGNEVSFNGTVVQALMMMNGRELNEAINSRRGTVAKMLEVKNASAENRINFLYLTALNRFATPQERMKIMDIFRTSPTKTKDPAAPWQDLYWALLNSNEFLLNH